MSLPDNSPSTKLTRLDEVLAEHMGRLDRGEAVDRDQFIADHPEVAAELRDYFRTTDEVVRAAPGRPASLRPDGRTLADYELLEEIARGGMGVVYKARQKSLNRIVALKMILAGQLASPADVQRFRTEAEAAASLHHPHIVPIYEIGEDQGRHFFSLELIEGGSLAQRLREFVGESRKASRLMAVAADAVHYAHQHGILHRDLKPANILIDQRGEPHVTDFGLARRFHEDSDLTPTGEIVGTPRYMAPEQAIGHVRRLTVAADVYSLGAILYELLTGQPAFSGATMLETLMRVRSEEPLPPSRVAKAVPRDLETICLKCLHKEPGRRYASAGELADELRRYLNHEPIRARPSGLWERGVMWAKRRPAYAVLIGAAAVTTVTFAVWATESVLRMWADLARQTRELETIRQTAGGMYQAAKIWFEDSPSGQLDANQEEFLTRAVSLFDGLTQRQSDDPRLKEEIALASFQLGEIQRLRQHREESEVAYRRAITLQKQLRSGAPAEPRFRQQLAESYNWLGELLRLTGGRLDEAEAQYRQARDLQLGLTTDTPEVLEHRRDLARSHYNIGIVAMDTGRDRDALDDFNRAVALLSRLRTEDPAAREIRHELARCSINRAILNKEAGQFAPARDDYLQAIALLQDLNKEVTNRAVYKLELAIAGNNLGNQLKDSAVEADRAEALIRFREALALARGLVDWFPDRPLYRKELANIHNSFGAALLTSDVAAAAEQWTAAGLELAWLTERCPGVADYHGVRGRTAGNLGLLQAQKNEWAAALPFYEEAVTHLRQALANNPLHPGYRKALLTNRQSLTETLVQLRRHGPAAEAARQLAATESAEALTIYFAACFFARCVPLAVADASLEDVQRQERAESYADESVRMLRKAVLAGFRDAARLQKDQADIFLPIAGRREFKDALRGLNEVTKP